MLRYKQALHVVKTSPSICRNYKDSVPNSNVASITKSAHIWMLLPVSRPVTFLWKQLRRPITKSRQTHWQARYAILPTSIFHLTITAQRAFEIIAMNRAGEKPESLSDVTTSAKSSVVDLAEQESLTRFDKSKNKSRNKSRNKSHHRSSAADSGNSNQHASSDNRQQRNAHSHHENKKRDRYQQKSHSESTQ